MSGCFARLAVRILICITGFATAAPAATPPEPRGELTLRQAVATTLARNPDLEVGSFDLLAGDARIAQATLRPNPDASLELEDFAGTGDVRGTDALQTTLSLSQVVELGAKRPRRVDVATADREMLGVELQARELDLLGEVTRRFIDVVAAQERLRLARETVDLVEKSRQAIQKRVDAARTPQAELSRAVIAVTRANLDLEQAQSVLDSARQSLASMWGGAEARFGAAKADLFSLAPLASFEVLLEKLDRNPDFVRFASESRLREAELRLAQAQARPNLTLGLGLRRYEGSNDTALVAGFSIGLPLFDRNQGNIAEAAARRAQSQAQERAARIRARATLYGLFQQVRASRRQLTTLQRDALPQAQAALEQTQTGYDRGRFSYLELATAQQDLLALRTAVIDAAADAHRLTAEIERLTNEPVATTSQDFRTPP